MNTISVTNEVAVIVINDKKLDASLPIIECGDCSGYDKIGW